MELCCNFCENMQLKMLHIARIKQHKEEGVFVWSHNCYHDCAKKDWLWKEINEEWQLKPVML